MKATLWTTGAFVAGVLIGPLIVPESFAQLRTVNTNPPLTADLAGWCDGKEVTIELNEAGSGTSGRHYHPAHSFTYLLEGSESYALDGQPSTTVWPGQVLHESPMQIHTVDNLSPVKLLVVRIIEKGKQATVRLP